MEPTPLQALVGRLIPASPELGAPGADDPAIFADIVGTLAPGRAELAGLLADLGQIGAAAIAERPLEVLLAEIVGVHGAAFGLVSVAVIQAYIFTMLTCMYLNDALHPGQRRESRQQVDCCRDLRNSGACWDVARPANQKRRTNAPFVGRRFTPLHSAVPAPTVRSVITEVKDNRIVGQL